IALGTAFVRPGLEQLERNRSPQLGVEGFIHDAHAARADLADDDVAIDAGASRECRAWRWRRVDTRRRAGVVRGLAHGRPTGDGAREEAMGIVLFSLFPPHKSRARTTPGASTFARRNGDSPISTRA